MKKLAIIVKNNGLRPVNFAVTRSGIDGPSHDYQAVGKNLRNIISRNKIKNSTLGFGKTLELLSGEGMLLPTDQLLTGTIDFLVTDRLK